MKKIRIAFIVLAGLFFYSILLSSFVRNIYLNDDSDERWGVLAKPVRFMAEIPSLAKRSLQPGEFMLSNSEQPGGVSYAKNVAKSEYPKLLVSYKDMRFGQKVELIDLTNGKTIKRWEPDNQALYRESHNPENPQKQQEGSDLYFLHPFLAADSSLIFTSQLTSLMARIDSNNGITWLKKDRRYHHTIEQDHEGKLFVCSRPFLSGKYDFLPVAYDAYKEVLIDDAITRIDPGNGNLLFNKSVLEILLENGYEKLLLGKGQFISDPIHLNDIQPALEDSEFWKKGDLLVSCRNLSAVFLYRPSTNKILWLRQGPWYNQHDADFLDHNKIVVFGNDVIREESTIDPRMTDENLFFSNKRANNDVYIYNFEKDSVITPYNRLMKNEGIRTYTSGRCEILTNGEVFIEDTNNGRIIIGDSIQKKIEYVKRIDDEHISSLFWSRIIY